MKMKRWFFATSILLFQGCATIENSPIAREQLEIKAFTYTDLTGDKEQLWNRANNYFASAYNNSKAVLRTSSQIQGTIIGKGIVSWKIRSDFYIKPCYSEYQIRFVAKEHKARLQLELLEGTPPLSNCVYWTLPGGYGYQQVMDEFNEISSGLGKALRGEGKIESMKDF